MEPHPLQQGRRQGFIIRRTPTETRQRVRDPEKFTTSWHSAPLQTYVRDIYPFRRSVSPQLNLVHMLPEKGQELIQKQVRKMSDLTPAAP